MALTCLKALVYLKPKRVAMTDGYMGIHGSLDVYRKTTHDAVEIIGIDDEFKPGDLCWIETPLNPTGESR